MAASPNSEHNPRRSGITITRGGVTHVFESRDEARAFAQQPMTEMECEQLLEALRMSEDLRARILERTGGRGITQEDLDDALRAAKDH